MLLENPNLSMRRFNPSSRINRTHESNCQNTMLDQNGTSSRRRPVPRRAFASAIFCAYSLRTDGGVA